MKRESWKPLNLLLVEHDELQALSIQQALVEAKVANPVHLVRSIDEAYALLDSQDPEALSSKRWIVVLGRDLSNDDLGVLQRFRQHPAHRDTWVVMLSEPQAGAERAFPVQLHPAMFIQEPQWGEEFVRVVEEVLDGRWRLVTREGQGRQQRDGSSE